ncbi:flagellar hook-length control protein FliK [Pseudoduganella sp. SL102]|uniref:flagellar hook-length control protein FliK n=1 Tax=Pseudoduganella sp. SL102 TaxID=2995154 RepID=UPI00248C2FC1|nr:flagellar hook-length control protein FliK [Pseudoduganella sp. SL102]WBS00823.1 flagellar hook-length control protein FliK [Pseudoduganella sp. SL102]
MMMTIPSAPGGAAAAPGAQSAIISGDAAFAATPATVEGVPTGTPEDAGLPMMFAQLFDAAALAMPAGTAATADGAGEPASEASAAEAPAEQATAEVPLAAMMPALPFALPAQAAAAMAVNLAQVANGADAPAGRERNIAPAGSATAPAAGTASPDSALVQARGIALTGAIPGQAAGVTLPAAGADSARQAAADAITAAAAAVTAPQAAQARLATGDAMALRMNAMPFRFAADRDSAAARTVAAMPTVAPAQGNAAQAASVAPAAVLAGQDGMAQPGAEGQSGQPQGDSQASFRGVMAAAAPAAGAAAPADTVRLAGTPEQWQQPLRAALGDRLQVTLQKGNDQAVIRLEPPNLGSIEISIRQTAGALHVSMSATNSEVVRQLNAVGDSMRQDLSQRQQGDVAVTVSQASSRSLADSEGRGRQPEREAEQQREQRGPGRALNEGNDTNTTFAMLRE